jgi:glycosyltransferase involved in cell wall biosynthesis
MKILQYINNLGSGGAEKLLSDILPLMQKQGHEVFLVVSNNKDSVKKFEQIIIDSGIKIINLKKSFYNPFQIFQLVDLLRKGDYDIVHAHLFPSQYWLAIASLFKPFKTKLVKTEHSVFNERKNYKILRPIEKFVYKRYTKIICITQEVKNNLKEWLERDSDLLVIHNGVNLKEFKYNEEKIKLVKNLFNKKDKNILMVGRFDGIAKDQKTVINALKLLPNNYKLFFAGEGPELNNIKKYAIDQNLISRIEFLGLRHDVCNLMSGADINVLSTNYEGLSGVTLESLASGKPFVGSNVVGVNTIVPNENFLFEKGNFVELANKIKKIINDDQLSKNMIKEASEFVGDFDIEIMVKNYLQLYKYSIL